MVFGVGVDLPEVVGGVVEEVFCGEDGGHHGVVLVVVFVHAVAADDLKVGEVFEGGFDDVDVVLVTRRVDGIGFFHADDGAVVDFIGADEAELLKFIFAEGDELFVGGVPKFVVFEAKIFEAEAGGCVCIGEELGAPVVEVLDAAEFYGGVVDVDPVVGEKMGAGDHEGDGEEVAVL